MDPSMNNMVEQLDPRVGPISGRRKRTARVTNTQVEVLLGLLEARSFLFTRRFTELHGRENFDAGWREATTELNNVPSGSCKTPEQLITVWRDMKSRACSKAAKLRKERVQTGNRGVTTAPLTEVEKRIIFLVGVEYTLGTECPESMPEEDNIQQQQEAGEHVEEFVLIPQSQDSIQELPPLQQQEPSAQVQETQQEESDSQAAVTTSPPPARRVRDRRVRNRNLNPRQSVAEQYNSARRDFQAIAQSNADSMSTLAAATLMHAEVAKAQVEATKALTDAFLLFSQAANKLADAVVSAINK